MDECKKLYYDKRAKILIKNLQSRHFEAYYCHNAQEALKKALSMIPEGATIGWGGTQSVQQIGLIDAVKSGNYDAIDRAEYIDKDAAYRKHMCADVFLTSANAISLDGQMVNIDGSGNRVGAIIYGPTSVLVIASMNKVTDTIEDAITRARTIAAPLNQQRFLGNTPCAQTGICGDCRSEDCICNQIVITRNCRPAGRIKFILVGEDLGF